MNESAAQEERGLDFRRVGHPRDQPLQMEEDLAVAGRGGAGKRWANRVTVLALLRITGLMPGFDASLHGRSEIRAKLIFDIHDWASIKIFDRAFPS